MVRSLYLKPLHDIARHGRQGGSLKAPWWLPAVSARCWQSDTSVDEQCYKQVRSPAIETGFTQAGLLLASTELCNSSLFIYLFDSVGLQNETYHPKPIGQWSFSKSFDTHWCGLVYRYCSSSPGFVRSSCYYRERLHLT